MLKGSGMVHTKALRLAAYLFAFVAIAALSSCDENKATSSPAGPPPPEVTVMTAESRNLPAVFEYVGQIAGIREVEVRPRISGILQNWNYKEGAKVDAGESLFTIDPGLSRRAR
jgi:membrane fusion protein (multidrug efflux system)